MDRDPRILAISTKYLANAMGIKRRNTMKHHDYIIHAPSRVRHNGKTLHLQQPTKKEMDEMNDLRRSVAERRAAEKEARAMVTSIKGMATI
jgi:hypothetical protein